MTTKLTPAGEALEEFNAVGNYEVLGKTRETIEEALQMLDRIQRGETKELRRDQMTCVPEDVMQNAAFDALDERGFRVTASDLGITAPQLAPGWLPIASAPRNKTVMVWWKDQCWWGRKTKPTFGGKYGWSVLFGSGEIAAKPTDWQPLPPAPKANNG